MGAGGARIRTSSRLPGRAKPGGRRRCRAARVASPVAPGGQDSFLSFASVLSSLRSREQQIVLDWLEKGVRPRGQNPQHSLHAFAEQSFEGPARPRRGAGGRWEVGERRGGQAGPGAARDRGGREGAGRLPFPARPGALLSLFYSCRSIWPEVNSTMKASSSPVNGCSERITSPRESRRRRRRHRLVLPQHWAPGGARASRAEGGGRREGGFRWL